MKFIDIKYIEIDPEAKLEDISKHFENLDTNNINNINWENYPYLPAVKFMIFYSEQNIYIK